MRDARRAEAALRAREVPRVRKPYLLRRRRISRAIPAMPVASNAVVAGSGTDTVGSVKAATASGVARRVRAARRAVETVVVRAWSRFTLGIRYGLGGPSCRRPVAQGSGRARQHGAAGVQLASSAFRSIIWHMAPAALDDPPATTPW